ncbi:MAG: YeeE/YedE thiosulfate transporter family protein [Candidatus Kapabacteria bacterium]|nr:YeeE/YedE thiosulfate transporter family protein [Candidatus Kapabacteria bacterium]
MMPYFKFDYFGSDTGLFFAFIIGIGFGWFLERAGFGTAKKLAAQFYFKDLTVFKVMFTAIVTAMLGIYFLSVFGFMDISELSVTTTYIVPQIVGGLMLGVGFVIGGYCPGTSVVACSTGKIDAVFFLIGVFLGIFIFAELYPLIENFSNSTNMGKVTMPAFFNIPYGIIVFLVVLMALGGFAGAEWAEKKFGYKKVEVINED